MWRDSASPAIAVFAAGERAHELTRTVHAAPRIVLSKGSVVLEILGDGNEAFAKAAAARTSYPSRVGSVDLRALPYPFRRVLRQNQRGARERSGSPFLHRELSAHRCSAPRCARLAQDLAGAVATARQGSRALVAATHGTCRSLDPVNMRLATRPARLLCELRTLL